MFRRMEKISWLVKLLMKKLWNCKRRENAELYMAKETQWIGHV